MAQGRFSSIGNFYVKDKRAGNYYPATFLVDPNGAPVVDSVLARGLSRRTPRRN